jgi:hypothetical protein
MKQQRVLVLRRPTPACWRRCGWLVLLLTFAAAAGVQVFLALSMTVTWPLFVAMPAAGMGGCCAVRAWRER